MSLHCVVVGCSNGSYRLNKWKTSKCQKHVGLLHEGCGCEEPFRLFPFPTLKKDKEMREKWIKMVNRVNTSSKKELFDPGRNYRVCSVHFKDGRPTPQHPLPSLLMGYDNSEQRSLLFSPPSNSRKRKSENETFVFSSSSSSSSSSSQSFMSSMQPASTPTPSSNSCLKKLIRIQYPTNPPSIQTETPAIQLSKASSPISSTTTANKIFQKANKILKSKAHSSTMKEKKHTIEALKKEPLFKQLLKNDQKCLFYTNLPKLHLFDKLHDIMKGFVRNRFHRKIIRTSNLKNKHLTPKKRGRQRTLHSKDEMLLTLMKLRLGSLFEDLGDRFGVCKSAASKIFQCWIRTLSKSLECMIYLPEDEQKIWETSPQRFKKFSRLNGIIDCSEVFIETPKNLELQRATWSEYKHHNTIKFLISVLPNSFISFVSKPYTGAISDKAIVIDTNLLETLPPHCSLMTDKGFSNIATECSEHSIHLIVPPGRKGNSQMTPDEVIKTSEIAKTRILVEQVIRRIKTFKILAGEVPVSLLRHLNDIMVVCCAISNCREPIMK